MHRTAALEFVAADFEKAHTRAKVRQLQSHTERTHPIAACVPIGSTNGAAGTRYAPRGAAAATGRGSPLSEKFKLVSRYNSPAQACAQQCSAVAHGSLQRVSKRVGTEGARTANVCHSVLSSYGCPVAPVHRQAWRGLCSRPQRDDPVVSYSEGALYA